MTKPDTQIKRPTGATTCKTKTLGEFITDVKQIRAAAKRRKVAQEVLNGLIFFMCAVALYLLIAIPLMQGLGG